MLTKVTQWKPNPPQQALSNFMGWLVQVILSFLINYEMLSADHTVSRQIILPHSQWWLPFLRYKILHNYAKYSKIIILYLKGCGNRNMYMYVRIHCYRAFIFVMHQATRTRISMWNYILYCSLRKHSCCRNLEASEVCFMPTIMLFRFVTYCAKPNGFHPLWPLCEVSYTDPGLGEHNEHNGINVGIVFALSRRRSHPLRSQWCITFICLSD
jgi:hypothetical protein